MCRDELRDDCQSLIAKGITGNSDALMPAFSGIGNRLDSNKINANPTDPAKRREMARKAAEKRVGRSLQSTGGRLGGNKNASPVPLKEVRVCEWFNL